MQTLQIYSLVGNIKMKYFMQHFRNGEIIDLTIVERIIFVKTNFTP